jgi:hypothetical protein
LVVNLGDGDGTFGPDIGSGQAQIRFSGSSFVLRDVNGDGQLDAINPGNNAALGDGAGHFFAAPRPSFGLPGGSIAVADVNGDGKLDVIGQTTNRLLISTGFGDGSFTDFVFVPVPNLAGLGDVLADDLNYDGLVDLIMANEGELDLLLNNGDGTYQAPIRLHAPGVTRASNRPISSVPTVLADVNQDGLLDLLAAETVLLRKH